MIAAIYARKSTDQQDKADEAKSVARQIERAREYAAREGWAVADEHVYVDDAVSGADHDKLVGRARLLNALKPRPSFQVLVMMEESRLGRDQEKTPAALFELARAGVRVFCYQTGEVKMHDPLSVAMMQLRVSFATMERHQGSVRTHDAMLHKARAGHAVGGRVFGYTTTELRAADGRRLHVERRVHEAEAAVVRRIFSLYADGVGFLTIARTLNNEHTAAPVPRRRGRLAGWAPSSIREILYRELYRGVIVWNRTKKRDPFGRKRQAPRDPADWIRHEVPALRIVAEALWDTVQRRLARARATYLRVNHGQVWGRPPGDAESKYLLTNFTVCGHCGGTLYVRSRAHGRRRFFYYACSTATLKGKRLCPNFLRLPMDVADEAVLTAIETDLLHPAVVTRAIEKAQAVLMAAAPETTTRVAAAETALARLGAELARLVEAVRHGGALASLVAEIQRLELERSRLEAQLAALRAPTPTVGADELPAAIERALTDWRGLLRRQTAQARQILGRLLPGRVVFTPNLAAGTWTMRAECSLGRIVAGLLGTNGLVAPTGFEPVFQP